MFATFDFEVMNRGSHFGHFGECSSLLNQQNCRHPKESSIVPSGVSTDCRNNWDQLKWQPKILEQARTSLITSIPRAIPQGILQVSQISTSRLHTLTLKHLYSSISVISSSSSMTISKFRLSCALPEAAARSPSILSPRAP